jgi:hypothetical protein
LHLRTQADLLLMILVHVMANYCGTIGIPFSAEVIAEVTLAALIVACGGLRPMPQGNGTAPHRPAGETALKLSARRHTHARALARQVKRLHVVPVRERSMDDQARYYQDKLNFEIDSWDLSSSGGWIGGCAMGIRSMARRRLSVALRAGASELVSHFQAIDSQCGAYFFAGCASSFPIASFTFSCAAASSGSGLGPNAGYSFSQIAFISA